MTDREDALARVAKRAGRPKFLRQTRTWQSKFHDSFSGFRQSIEQQSSYRVHFFFAALTLGMGYFFSFDIFRWALLTMAITVVITTEMLNTAIEMLAREVTDEDSEFIRQALNIASGAVLMVSMGAALVGILLFGEAIFQFYMTRFAG